LFNEEDITEIWRYFVDIICNLVVSLKRFRDCWTGYTVNSLLPCYGLLTALVVLNSVARWCNVILLACVHGHREYFSRGGTSGLFRTLFRGDGGRSVDIFYNSTLEK